MKYPSLPPHQSGATLVVGLIMLVLITLLVVSALSLSTTNLMAVGNMQYRNEAIAAANQAIGDWVSAPGISTSTTTLGASASVVDIGPASYSVTVTPSCISVSNASASSVSSLSLGSGMSASGSWNTVWDLDTPVTEAGTFFPTGVVVEIHHGVRFLLTQSQACTVCKSLVNVASPGLCP